MQTNFPKLIHLNLSLTLIDDLLILDQDFIDVLFLRPLVQLDVSDNNLEISFFNVSKLCSSLAHLLIHDTAAHYDEIFYDVEECSSLRIVDMSKELGLVNFFKDLNCVNSTVGIREFDFYGAVETMYINRCITSHLTAVNCSLEMYVNSSVKDLHFAQNHIPEFNFSLVNPNIKFVNLSYNEIENIDSDALVGLPSLQKLDFSHNQIYKIKPLDTTVPNLFNRNLNLQVIDLSFNWLTYLPKRTFSANINLKQLHLNGNKLGQISFDISNLLNLTILDLRFNSIGFLDNFSRTTLTDLYKSQKQRNPNETGYIVQILLDGNPFSCSCQFLDFLRWFVASPIFSSPHRYSCELNGDVFALDKDAVKQSEEDCERPIRQRRIIVLSTTLPTIAVAVMVITALYVFKRRKRKLVDQRYADKVRLLREDNIGFVYPVFLSYSSVDHDFVVPNTLRPLEHRLETITNIKDRDLVCFAEKHFTPGQTLMSEMIRCLENSSVFIAVMSKQYCLSHFCKFEIEQAHVMDKPIILIFKERVNETDMNSVTREIFRNYTRVKCVIEDGQHTIQPGWNQICDAIIQLM